MTPPSHAPSRRVLIVSPAFPPLNAPDLQRVRMSLPYYRQHGWEPIVLAVNPSRQEGGFEESLLATVPADVAIHRCGALPLGLTRWFGLHNTGLRAWWHLLFAGSRLIRRGKIDLVYFSTTQFAVFPLGRIWRRLHGVPYVIDLQDPWITDHYEKPGAPPPPGGWKYRFARVLARVLESWSFRRLAGFISVSEKYLQDLRARYPWFAAIPSDVIRFGGSENDLEAARRLPAAPGESAADGNGLVRLVYTGAAGPILPHAARVLFRGLARFRAAHPEDAHRLRLEFLGTSYAAADRARPTVLAEADTLGVRDCVVEQPARLGHLECLRIQSEADALLLLGSSDPAYSPSKLYPYFLSGRPILAVVFSDSVLAGLLHQLNCSVLAEFEDPEDTEAAEKTIAQFLAQAVNGFPPGSLPLREEALFRREYLAPALTERQCRLFDRAVAPKSA